VLSEALLSGALCLPAYLQLALGKIYLLLAAWADVSFVKFIREDFLLGPAVGASAGEGLKVLERLETGTVSGCGHILTSPFRVPGQTPKAEPWILSHPAPNGSTLLYNILG